MLPKSFQHQMKALLGVEYPVFEASLQAQPSLSIRYNPFKINGLQLPPQTDPVPWHPDAYYLSERPVFTLDPLFHAGAYYVQEASSMMIREAILQTTDVTKRLKVLDLCAAPGGKSTLLASMLSAESLLVANEVIRSRTAPLRENLEKWGCANIAITSAEAEELATLEGWFDVVVADAPCSGEGMFRKDPEAVKEWSPAHVELCSTRQRRIIAAAVEALAPGGVLVYSTCTFNRAENEENIAWFCAEMDLEPVHINISPEWGIVQTDGGMRFYPHKTRGEGFFMSVLRKKEYRVQKHKYPTAFKMLKPLSKNQVPHMAQWITKANELRYFQTPHGEVMALPACLEGEYLLLDNCMKLKWFGIPVGEFKGNDLIPSHSLAMSNIICPNIAALELSHDQALHYLKKETLELPPEAPKGWVLARYQGLNLGWMKVLPNRMNNYLPPERRIRMELK